MNLRRGDVVQFEYLDINLFKYVWRTGVVVKFFHMAYGAKTVVYVKANTIRRWYGKLVLANAINCKVIRRNT